MSIYPGESASTDRVLKGAAVGVRGDDPGRGPSPGEGPRSEPRSQGGIIRESVNGVEPPLGNTGGNSPNLEQNSQIGIGWLKLRLTKNSYRTFFNSLTEAGITWDVKRSFGGSRQHRLFGAEWQWGGCVYWGRAADEEQPEFWPSVAPDDIDKLRPQAVRVGDISAEDPIVELSDSALAHVMSRLVVAGRSFDGWLGDLLGDEARVLRLDLSIDLPGVSIEPVDQARLAKDFLPMRTHSFADSRGQGKGGGRTCYFGARGKDGSGVFVRFYEKGKQLNLPFDMLRYEVELSKERAQDAAWRIISGGATNDIIAGILAGAIDFREGYGSALDSTHAARDSVRYSWWQRILTALKVEPVKLVPAKKIPTTVQGVFDWVELAWPRALAMMEAVWGMNRTMLYLRELMERGRDLLTEEDKQQCGAARLIPALASPPSQSMRPERF